AAGGGGDQRADVAEVLALGELRRWEGEHRRYKAPEQRTEVRAVEIERVGENHDHPLPGWQAASHVERKPAVGLSDELAERHHPVFVVLADQAQELGPVVGCRV